jgi:hypothetical protein
MILFESKSKNIDNNGEAGQSLIETIVGIFILSTALTASLGVIIYSFAASSASQSEIIASNLAREGTEVVRMMRDSNWLAGDVKGNAWDLQACSDIGGRLCFPRAYQQVPPYNNYDLDSGNQRAIFDSSDSSWALDSNGPLNFDLYLQPDGTYTHDATAEVSVFARMINISLNTAAPYTNENSNQEMIVKSVVAWRGKGCTAFTGTADLLALSTPCKIVVEEHLTNWKDYK